MLTLNCLFLGQDSLKLTVEAKPLVSSSFNESHSTTSASLGPPVSRPTATQRNSKRNILDSLLAVDSAGREGDDYDSKMSKQKTEINMDESFEIKAGPMSGSSRRSVRFSENLVSEFLFVIWNAALDINANGCPFERKNCGLRTD